MHAQPLNTRNEALEFARRTRLNLEFIKRAKEQNPKAEVHVVTQLTLSLLGLVVFPKEKLFLNSARTMKISDLSASGWPSWNITRDEQPKEWGKKCDNKPKPKHWPTQTLADIIYHMRNAIAHGRITFTSSPDSPRLEEVGILVEDKEKPSDPDVYWRAEISGPDLEKFCLRFLDFIKDELG